MRSRRVLTLAAAIGVLLVALAITTGIGVAQGPGAATNVSVYAKLADDTFVSHGLTIPANSTIFWTDAEVTAAAARYNASPSTYPLISPSGNAQRVFRQCDLYKLTGTFTASNGHSNFTQIDTTGDVIDWLMGTSAALPDRNGWLYPGGSTNEDTADYSQNMDDPARYFGFVTLRCVSILWPVMSSVEREYILRRLVRAIAGPLNKEWGSPVDTGNNYMWAYTANAVVGAAVLASHARGLSINLTTNCDRATGFETGGGANAISVCNKTIDQIIDTFLDEGLDVRYANLVAYLNAAAKGGWVPESQNYGHYLLAYISEMMQVCEQFGLDLSDDTPYWREVAWGLIHQQSNRALYPVQAGVNLGSGVPSPAWQQFATSGNTQTVYGSPFSGALEEGEYMTWAVRRWPGTYLAARIRYWLTNTNPQRWLGAKVKDTNLGDAGTGYAALPLAQGGTGYHRYIVRTDWNAGSSDKPVAWILFGETIDNSGGNHARCDYGSWQVWRGQRWVSKEASAAYNRAMTNLAGNAPANAGSHFFSNTFGFGQAGDNGFCNEPLTDPPVVTRVQNHTGSAGLDDDFFYLAGNYTAHVQDNLTAGGNVSAAWRDFVVVPQLNAMCTFDRLTATSGAVVRSEYVHFPANPSASGATYTGVNNGEELKLFDLSGSIAANTTITRVVRNESSFLATGAPFSTSGCSGAGPWIDCDPQHRLQVDISGPTTVYAPMCAQAYSTGDTTMSAAATEDGSNVTVTLTQTGKDTVTLVFPKQTTSTGGSITIGATQTNFSNTIQTWSGDENGNGWN